MQAYTTKERWVRFNEDQTYHEKSGDADSVAGCVGKTIDQLRSEGRTYRFLSEG